ACCHRHARAALQRRAPHPQPGALRRGEPRAVRQVQQPQLARAQLPARGVGARAGGRPQRVRHGPGAAQARGRGGVRRPGRPPQLQRRRRFHARDQPHRREHRRRLLAGARAARVARGPHEASTLGNREQLCRIRRIV
ncbi:MAG: 6-pyruvoyl tetrahydrobiopterin synthase, partial [uncultured Gemmatimonadaceae bacterium]